MGKETGLAASTLRGALKPEAVARVIVKLATGRGRVASGAAVDVT